MLKGTSSTSKISALLQHALAAWKLFLGGLWGAGCTSLWITSNFLLFAFGGVLNEGQEATSFYTYAIWNTIALPLGRSFC